MISTEEAGAIVRSAAGECGQDDDFVEDHLGPVPGQPLQCKDNRIEMQ